MPRSTYIAYVILQSYHLTDCKSAPTPSRDYNYLNYLARLATLTTGLLDRHKVNKPDKLVTFRPINTCMHIHIPIHTYTSDKKVIGQFKLYRRHGC